MEGTYTASSGAAADVQGLRGFLEHCGRHALQEQEQTSISRNLWGQLCQEDLSVLEGQADQTPVGMQDGPRPLRRKGRRREAAGWCGTYRKDWNDVSADPSLGRSLRRGRGGSGP